MIDNVNNDLSFAEKNTEKGTGAAVLCCAVLCEEHFVRCAIRGYQSR